MSVERPWARAIGGVLFGSPRIALLVIALVSVLGFAALILGIQELLSDLRNGVLDNGADIIAGLALYVGVGIMYFGSRQTSG